jgi:hypothetical protein
MRLKILLGLAIALTCGWGTHAQTNHTGSITFFRLYKYVGHGNSPILSIDGKPALQMDNGRYYTIELEAGEHVLEIAKTRHVERPSPITIKLKAGDDLYFECSRGQSDTRAYARVELGIGLVFGLAPWPADQAKEEIKKLMLLDTESLISKEAKRQYEKKYHNK